MVVLVERQVSGMVVRGGGGGFCIVVAAVLFLAGAEFAGAEFVDFRKT